ncbi:MAG: alpha/beta hydrolase [Verrucomicrobia bacterium]|jgi:acetyl esterase/lipase|nr:alpha/beta hydrolase [Verrucomicrobiota bacterium]
MIEKMKSLLLCVCLSCAFSLQAEVVRLWEGDAPGAMGKEEKDIPTLTIFRPEKPNGAAMILTPGGGYHHVSTYEGTGNALYLNQYGITAFVLKYRVDPYRHPAMLQDVQRAIRLVRYNAEKWGVDPERVGVMGGSAGGHLSCMAVVHGEDANDKVLDPIERLSSRPNIGVLCYAVITMMGNEFVPGEFADMESKDCLLGKGEFPDGLCAYLSGEKMVSKKTPPCFIWNTLEDDDVAVENALDFAQALRKNSIPFALHVYEKGGHGYSPIEWKNVDGKPQLTGKEPHPWAKDLIEWLKIRHFVE